MQSPARRRRIGAVQTGLRFAVALAWGSLFVMSLNDYHGHWRLLSLGVALVGGMILLAEARLRHTKGEPRR